MTSDAGDRMIRTLYYSLLLIGALILSACTAPPPQTSKSEAQNIAELTQSIRALGDHVDAAEAARAAAIAYRYTSQLAIEYEITDPPLVHNAKVNAGIKPRGLCWHWAEDMQNRLNAEAFETLDIHRAIANADNPFLIDHSTALISAKGDTMHEAIVLDPWRFGGILFWSPIAEDTRYAWHPQAKVLDQRRQQNALRARRTGSL